MFAYYAQWLPKFSDRSYALSKATVFPLARKEIETLEDLKKGLLRACLVSIGVREGILLGGRKNFALKITIALKIDNLTF